MNKQRMKLSIAVVLVIAGSLITCDGGELMTRVLQPPYAANAKGEPTSSQWLLDELWKCDETLDLIVLPEFSDIPARIGGAEFHAAMSDNNERILRACAEAAKRCKAIRFVNALYETPQVRRNTTHAFDRTGACVGRYFKRHVTADVHGIGFAKKPFLVESLASEGRALMCGIKRIFDPEGILNPHKVVS